MQSNLDDLFCRLSRSTFRSRFRLNDKDRAYLAQKGLDVVLSHGRDFIAQRLAPAVPKNDGKQTPMRGHPIFVAQHATATCCRGCLEKWHAIAHGHEIDAAGQKYILAVIARWLAAQTSA